MHAVGRDGRTVRMGEAVGVWTARHCAPGPIVPSQCWRNPSRHSGDSEAAG